MAAARSLLDDGSFDSIGRARAASDRRPRVSARHVGILAILLIGVALVGLWNLGAFGPRTLRSDQGVGATNTAEVQAEWKLQREASDAAVKAGLVEPVGS